MSKNNREPYETEAQVADFLIGGDEYVYPAIIETAYKIGGPALVKHVKRYETPYKMVPHYNVFEFLEDIEPGSKDTIKIRAQQLRIIDKENIKGNFEQAGLIYPFDDLPKQPAQQ